jgi:hypothetical protein
VRTDSEATASTRQPGMRANSSAATTTGVSTSSSAASTPMPASRATSSAGVTESVLLVKRSGRERARSQATASAAPGTARLPS